MTRPNFLLIGARAHPPPRARGEADRTARPRRECLLRLPDDAQKRQETLVRLRPGAGGRGGSRKGRLVDRALQEEGLLPRRAFALLWAVRARADPSLPPRGPRRGPSGWCATPMGSLAWTTRSARTSPCGTTSPGSPRAVPFARSFNGPTQSNPDQAPAPQRVPSAHPHAPETRSSSSPFYGGSAS